VIGDNGWDVWGDIGRLVVEDGEEEAIAGD
jgi:hypothetical protein